MKNRLFAVLLLSCCLIFASCSSDDGSKGKNEKPVPQVGIKVPENNGDASSVQLTTRELSQRAIEAMKKAPEYPEGYPTLEDAVKLYRRANMAIGWIISTEPVAVYEDDSIIVDGLEYKRVRPDCHYGAHNLEHHAQELGQTNKLIFDLDSLEAYLGTVINPEDAELYMLDAEELKKFTEDEDGNLYVLPFSYIPEGFGEETYSLDNNDDGTYTFNVTYALVDEDGNTYKEKTKSFDIIQTDGRWVFDDFRVIRQN